MPFKFTFVCRLSTNSAWRKNLWHTLHTIKTCVISMFAIYDKLSQLHNDMYMLRSTHNSLVSIQNPLTCVHSASSDYSQGTVRTHTNYANFIGMFSASIITV